MKHLPLNNQIFINNRKRFIKQLKPNSIALFVSNDEVQSNGDAIYRFKQNSDLYWLTGIQQEDTMLMLYPDNKEKKYKEVLILVRPNELKEKWDGKRLRAEEAKAISGIETIVWLDSFYALLQSWMHHAEHVYLPTNENDRKNGYMATRQYRFVEEIKKQYPLHQYYRSAIILKQLRAIKTKEEIEVVQKAIDITHHTFERVMKFTKPNVWEYEIEAEIIHNFLIHRSAGEAYGSIVASGDRARILHYVENNQQCKAGELLLLDFGAEYGGYCADLSRTIPVSGKFTPRQKQLYNACLQTHNYAKSLLKPGITILDYTELVGEFATKEFIKLGLITKADVKNEDKENRAYRKYLYHGISHHLGIDVHDLGTRNEPIQAGMLFTVEPGIYVEEEQCGIRIENNVWITKQGNIDLMKNIPITAEDIESYMQRK